MTVIVFRTKALADSILKEIAATPFGLVWCWYDPDDTENDVQYSEGADGRCMIAHPFSQEDSDWLEAYLAEWIKGGEVQIFDQVPEDWQYKQDVEVG